MTDESLVPRDETTPALPEIEASRVPARSADPIKTTRPMVQERLRSERVIINAPMSFAGAAQRAWRIGDKLSTGPRVLIIALVVIPVLLVWWTGVVFWYFAFGLLLLPYRLLRRGARKRKKEALRHREMLATLDSLKQDPKR